jgi:Ca-activated chloride channel homolog
MPLALRAWLDATSARPGKEARAHLVVELEASGAPVEGLRPSAATVLAVDVSGSMNGAPLTQVVRSVDMLVDGLRPEDRLGIIAFSDEATRVVAPVLMDAAGKRLVRTRAARLEASGNTNVEAGLELAVHELLVGPEVGRRGVVLLSDGVPNRGAVLAEQLRDVVRRHRPDVAFSSLGYGAEHNEDILSAIGDAGGGGYAFVPDPATCVRAFARALGAQADVVASAIELVIAPGEAVEIVGLVGREQARFGRDGIVVSLGDMVPGTRRVLVAEVAIRAPSDGFLVDVAKVRLRFQGAGAGAASTDLSLELAEREPAVVPEAMARVMLVRADLARGEARALADAKQFPAAALHIRATLEQIERVPGFVQGEASPLAEAYEQLVDEAMAFERLPSAEEYAVFRKATVGSKLAAPDAASSRSVASSHLLEHTAGDYPDAAVVVAVGPGEGKRFALRGEATIGRTAAAEIAIESASISRRHAEIYALEGAYWLTDLGSTNITEVNGARVANAPVKLTHGDVIRIGQVELRYEELVRTNP